jgi:hypothetical protein
MLSRITTLITVAAALSLSGCNRPWAQSLRDDGSPAELQSEQSPWPMEPPLVVELRRSGVPVTITPGAAGDLYLGYYDNGQLAAAMRWRPPARGRGRSEIVAGGFVGPVLTWHRCGAIRSIDSATGLGPFNHTWDEQGRLLGRTPSALAEPWNPGSLDNPPPPREVIDRLLAEVMTPDAPAPASAERPAPARANWYP